MLTVTNVVHPNTNDGRPGFRFGVYVTTGPDAVDPTDLSACVNAGWSDDADTALLAGAGNAATARGAIWAAARLAAAAELADGATLEEQQAAEAAAIEATPVTLADVVASVDYFPAPPS